MVKNSSKVLNEEECMVQPEFSNTNLRAAFSLKSIPVTGFEGRRSFAKKAGFDPNGLVILKQTHSTNVSFAKSVNTIENCDVFVFLAKSNHANKFSDYFNDTRQIKNITSKALIFSISVLFPINKVL